MTGGGQAHPHDALQVGVGVCGYEIIRFLGQGGFGIVYEARNPVTGRRVALKELYASTIRARRLGTHVVYGSTKAEEIELLAWARKKFRETTKMQISLDHPGICKVIDYLEANDTAYMLMEFLEGSDLSDWLTRQPTPLPADALRATFEPILDALSYLHARGFIHRDIKAANVFMAPGGRPVLIDLGALSHDLTRQTRIAGLSAGTEGVISPGYTAPEQCQTSVTPNAMTDVYSFGALLYRALTGRPPVEGTERALAIALRVAGKDPYRRLADAVPEGTDPVLAAAVDACLAYHQEDRPQSMEAVRHRLGWHRAGRLPDQPDASREHGVTPKTGEFGGRRGKKSQPSATPNGDGRESTPKARRPWISLGLLAGACLVASGLSMYVYLDAREGRLRDAILACDRAAAMSSDSERPEAVAGLGMNEIDPVTAVPICRTAVEAANAGVRISAADKRRLAFELGRALNRASAFGEAKTWYEKAAAAGSAAAMVELGSLYASGQGVTRDVGVARDWYEKAAAAGSTDAKFRLSELDREVAGAAAASRAGAGRATGEQSGVTTVQRAVLYEENTADPKAAPAVSQGRATWRLESASGEQGQPLRSAVRANVELPELGFGLVMTIRKNLDASLPASHTIELTFTSSGKGSASSAEARKRLVQEIGLLRLKDEEQSRGSPVSGLPVRVRDDVFLIGLSNLPGDIESNADLLTHKNWLDLAFKYRSGARAVLYFEKGAAGTRVMQSAFDQWR